MRNLLTFATLLLLLSSTAFAGDKMPLPPVFFDAKTIAIVNDSGRSDIGDLAYDELKKWGRYTIVSDTKKADLVVVLTSRVDYVGTVGNTTTQTTADVYGTHGTASSTSTQSSREVTRGKTYVIIFDGKTGERVWFDGRNWGMFKSATRGLIKDLKKRVEEQEKKK